MYSKDERKDKAKRKDGDLASLGGRDAQRAVRGPVPRTRGSLRRSILRCNLSRSNLPETKAESGTAFLVRS